MIPRRRPVPPARPRVTPARRYAIDSSLPQRGSTEAQVWVDTGILYALASVRGFLELFLAHVDGRLYLTVAVVHEIRRLAGIPTARRRPDQVRTGQAADLIERLVLAPQRATIVALSPADEDLLDRVTAQLRSLPKYGDEPADDHPLRHAGEAATIVSCVREARENTALVMLTNDGGASLIAATHGVRCRHLCDVLKELVCVGSGLTSIAAANAFARMATVSAPPKDCLPKNDEDFTCHRIGDICERCTRKS